MRCQTAHLGQTSLHNLRAVIDGENNISDSCVCQSLDLVHNHGLVAELDKRFRHRESLLSARNELANVVY